jgi:hypothetical protein
MTLLPYQELAVPVCLVLIVIILELVRRKRLAVRYSLVWLGVTFAMLVLSLWNGLLDAIRRSIGAMNLSSTLFFLGILFSLVILLHFSIKISEFSQQIRLLAKEIGLLRQKVEGEEPKAGSGPSA